MPQIAYWACWERRIGGRPNMLHRGSTSRRFRVAAHPVRIRHPARAPGAPPRPAWRLLRGAYRARGGARRLALGRSRGPGAPGGAPPSPAHQARAITALRAGRDVVLATPTASGKSLVYALPALEASLQDPEARALLLFPLRVLVKDQKKN